MENTAKSESGLNFGWFSPDQALAAFSAKFLDSDDCRMWILFELHRSKPACPYCKNQLQDENRLTRFWTGQRLACKKCDRFFTATTGTFLAGSHLGYRGFFLMSALLAAGLDNNQVAGVIDCTPETVRIWRRKFESLADLNITIDG